MIAKNYVNHDHLVPNLLAHTIQTLNGLFGTPKIHSETKQHFIMVILVESNGVAKHFTKLICQLSCNGLPHWHVQQGCLLLAWRLEMRLWNWKTSIHSPSTRLNLRKSIVFTNCKESKAIPRLEQLVNGLSYVMNSTMVRAWLWYNTACIEHCHWSSPQPTLLVWVAKDLHPMGSSTLWWSSCDGKLKNNMLPVPLLIF